MQSMTSAESITRNESARGIALMLAGLFILFVAMKYILFSSGLVETPRPGSLLFQIFDLLGRLSILW
jgi:hypothetical protein